MNYFTTHQLFFIVPQHSYDEELKKINVFLSILDKSGVGDIISKAYKKQATAGRKSYNPYHMFSTVMYCFAIKKSSLREIEEACIYDIRVMYLMDNETPSHKTICEFINDIVVPNQYAIFSLVTKAIVGHYKLDITNQYLDGTKLEANANKYKFVWKPTTFHKKLDEKIRKFFNEIGYSTTGSSLIKSRELMKALDEYVKSEKIDVGNIPQGKGKRLTSTQRKYKNGYSMLVKLIEYEEKEEICGEDRKSYYKTDHDATAMALKTDYYSGHGSNMHAAYNVQVMVASGLITFYDVFQARSDQKTLIPFLDKYYKYYGEYPVNLCADAGYGNYDNYEYLKAHSIENYVKFVFWNSERTGKKPQFFFYNPADKCVTCLGGNTAEEVDFKSNQHQRLRNSKLYRFSGCNECRHKAKCKQFMKNKDENYKIIEMAPDYEVLKEEARANLISRKGIEIRVNRSIQVEGSFGQIKQNMGFIRLRRRGMNKVSCEVMMMCLGRNIRKIFTMYNAPVIKSSYWNYHEN